MASLSGPILNFCRRCRILLTPLATTQNRIPFPIRFLFVPSVVFAESKKVLNLEPPDSQKLSQQCLLKSATTQTSDAVTTLLSQTAHSLIEAEQKYKETVDVLIQLLEIHLTVLGNKAEEDRVWDIVLEGRARVEAYEKHVMELRVLFGTVQKLVDAAAEAAFLAGSEFTSTSLGERLHNAQRHVEKAHEESMKRYMLLQQVQAESIQKVSEHAEKEEKKKKREEEDRRKQEEDRQRSRDQKRKAMEAEKRQKEEEQERMQKELFSSEPDDLRDEGPEFDEFYDNENDQDYEYGERDENHSRAKSP